MPHQGLGAFYRLPYILFKALPQAALHWKDKVLTNKVERYTPHPLLAALRTIVSIVVVVVLIWGPTR